MSDVVMNYSIGRVAKFCDVNRTTVGRWAEDGRLKTFRLPSGHLRVDRRDLLMFLQQYHMPIPTELKGVRKKTLALTFDPDLVDILRRSVLHREDVHVEFRVSGDPIEAGFELGHSKPDLLVVDLRVSECDVEELARLIASSKSLSHMATWVVGGYDKGENWQIPKMFGKILRKPWPSDVIKEKFEKIL